MGADRDGRLCCWRGRAIRPTSSTTSPPSRPVPVTFTAYPHLDEVLATAESGQGDYTEKRYETICEAAA